MTKYLLTSVIALACCTGCVQANLPEPQVASHPDIKKIVLVDYRFTIEEQQLIQTSIVTWASATGSNDAMLYPMFWAIIPEFPTKDNKINMIYKLSQYDPVYDVLMEHQNWGFDGVTATFNNGTHVIGLVPERLNPSCVDGFSWKDDRGIIYESSFTKRMCRKQSVNHKKFNTVLLHELGHFHGLDHGSGILMGAETDPINCIDKETIDSYCSIHRDCKNQHATCD